MRSFMSTKWKAALLAAGMATGSLAAAAPAGAAPAAPQAQTTIGVVNFRQCVEESKTGKQEQATFDQMRQQMTESLEKVQKELQEIGTKMADQEYMEGLSATAQTEMRNRFQELNNEIMQNQNQYYQILNQAHQRMVQGLMDEVSNTSAQIAKDQGLKLVVADEACFYYAPEWDLTKQVISSMDAHFVPAPVPSTKPESAKADSSKAAPAAKSDSKAAPASSKKS